MNRLTPQKANLFDLTHSLRGSVLGALQDADLSFRPGGDSLIHPGARAAFFCSFQFDSLQREFLADE